MVHWTCDRCESAVEGEPMTLLINATLDQQRPVVAHLCGDCRASFESWLVAPPAPPEGTPAPQPEGTTDASG